MWKKVKLGDVCDVLDKLRKPVTKKHRVSGDIPYYGATGVVDWVADFIFNEKLVLVGEDGAKWGAGDATAFIVDGKTWVNNHAHVLRPHDGTLLHEWLAYYLTAIDLSPWVTGLTVPKLNQAQLRSIPIPLPPLAEQQRIVAKLDAAFAEIDRTVELGREREKNVYSLGIALLDEVFSISYPLMKVGDLGDVKSGGTPNSKEASYWNGDIPWYSSGELNNLYTSPSEKHITQDGLDNSNAKLFPCGTLLIGMYDTAAMKMSILQQDATFNQAIVGIPPNDFASSEYLFYALNHLKPLILLERRGVRQQNLSLAKVKSIEIPIPNLDIQANIVKRLRELREIQDFSKQAMVEKRNQYQALKTSILAQELQPPESEAA